MTEERVEHLLAEVQDEFGVIRVLEVADYRFLEFGDAIEQSCVFTADPSWLEYDYTRAMLIGALCHEQPESALFLGLGAGTLTQACLKFLPLEDVEAIELRPDVPRLAIEYLGLPDPTHSFYREGYVRYDLVKQLSQRFALQMQGFHRFRYEPQLLLNSWVEGENYTALQWSPHLSLVFGYEYKAQTGCRPTYHDATGEHPGSDLCHFFNGGLTYRANVGDEDSSSQRVLGSIFNTVSVFLGQRRGATRCVSGVCRQFPPFEGAKLEITSRF